MVKFLCVGDRCIDQSADFILASCIINFGDMLCSIYNLSVLWPVRICTFSQLHRPSTLVF